MDIHNGRPGDVRNFVHKRIFGAVKGAVGGFISGGPVGAFTGGVSGFTRGGGLRTTPVSFAPARGCPAGFIMDPRTGECIELRGRARPGVLPAIQRTLPGGFTGRTEFGEAVLGRFGAALEPGVREMDTLVCPRGTVLGLDDLCYNRRDIKNSERKWPRGTRPLLTGGDMRAIRIASAAANKLQAKQKQLREMGMLPPAPKARKRKALPSGHHAHVAHD